VADLFDHFDVSPESLSGWTPVEITHEGRHIGTIAVKGMEVHVALKRTPLGSVRGSVRKALADLIDRFGMVTTRVPKSLTAANKFVRRIGFTPTWQDVDFTYYALSELPWERPKKEA
jgi:hypothetical protein